MVAIYGGTLERLSTVSPSGRGGHMVQADGEDETLLPGGYAMYDQSPISGWRPIHQISPEFKRGLPSEKETAAVGNQ